MGLRSRVKKASDPRSGSVTLLITACFYFNISKRIHVFAAERWRMRSVKRENVSHLSQEVVAAEHIRVPYRDPHGPPFHFLQRHHKLNGEGQSSLNNRTKPNQESTLSNRRVIAQLPIPNL
jgi:hypothetical protein